MSTLQAIQHVPLFDKCRGFTRAREAQAAGLYPYFMPITEAEDTVVTIHGKTKVMMGSNNYLGLTHHPKVLEAAQAALHKYGSGCTGSRFLNGTLDLHDQLEARLAEFLHKEACLVFSTGYQANLGLVSGLMGKGEVVYLDKLDHASIVDGASMSKAQVVRFNHGDLAGLERKLQDESRPQGAMIVVDGVFSMEGDIADLPHLVPLARKYGAALAVDDAHSIGVLGPTGAGTSEHFGLTDEVDLIVGTFSKSLASIGGFIAGAEYVVHFLKHHARPLIFTAALPASNTAGVLAALDILQSEPVLLRYRRSTGETRPLSEAPVHFVEPVSRHELESILCMIFFFGWDAWLFDAGGSQEPGDTLLGEILHAAAIVTGPFIGGGIGIVIDGHKGQFVDPGGDVTLGIHVSAGRAGAQRDPQNPVDPQGHRACQRRYLTVIHDFEGNVVPFPLQLERPAQLGLPRRPPFLYVAGSREDARCPGRRLVRAVRRGGPASGGRRPAAVEFGRRRVAAARRRRPARRRRIAHPPGRRPGPREWRQRRRRRRSSAWRCRLHPSARGSSRARHATPRCR